MDTCTQTGAGDGQREFFLYNLIGRAVSKETCPHFLNGRETTNWMGIFISIVITVFIHSFSGT